MAPIDPGAVLNIVSGVIMGVLGLALMATDLDRDDNRLFGLLAVFWSVQIVAANTVRLTGDTDLALFAGLLSLAFLIPLYFFIAAFAATFPEPRGLLGTSPLAVAALALPAGGALAALFLEPDLLLEGVATLPDGSLTLQWGSLLPYLVTAPFFGALSYALYVMLRRLDEASSPVRRKQITFVLAALAAFTAYYAPTQAIKFGGDALGLGAAPEAGSADALLIAGIMLATVVILGMIVVRLIQRLRRPPAEQAGQEARLVLTVIGVAAGAAGLGWTVEVLGGPQLELLGLFRAGSVGLIVYGIARYQLFDIDLRTKRWTAMGGAGLAGIALAAAAWVVLTRLSIAPALPAVGAVIVGAAAFLPALHVAYRVADRMVPGVQADGEHTYLRKLQVYRAAVEEHLGQGRPAKPEAPELAKLRDHLGLTERDHNVVVTLATAEAEPGQHRPALEPGSRAFGKYELEEVLAEGGFGRILKARDTLLGRPVVIKELLAKWRENEQVVGRFLREAQVAGQLDDPRIVSVYGVEQHGGDHYVIMEYLSGGSLADRLQDGSLGLGQAIRVAQGVLEALSSAHAHGVVHRDVKPGNVLLDGQGEVKLADFGIASLTRTDPDETLSGLTPDAPQPGSLTAMSPEQARGDPVDHRTDLYAVGALLYRMVTGRPHVDLDGLDEVAARGRIADGPEVALPDDVPAPLARVIETAMAKDPDDRFQNARGFLGALEEIQDELASPGSATGEGVPGTGGASSLRPG